MHDFKELHELILLEQFKQSLPEILLTYLNDLEVETRHKAAEAANNDVLIHKDLWHEKFSVQVRRAGDFEKRQVTGTEVVVNIPCVLPERWART